MWRITSKIVSMLEVHYPHYYVKKILLHYLIDCKQSLNLSSSIYTNLESNKVYLFDIDASNSILLKRNKIKRSIYN